ncbi:tetraspanin-4-like isoform X2 [Dreissena polymorpha]|uniref:tetraspanin-4-like isoform X2 n=1 Tax=Dreissena polymorpha TaxID=45954 RepID=UPI0022653AE6|nr:tetraspanin-4-like isoform X2 [Dreissena polymorpha]
MLLVSKTHYAQIILWHLEYIIFENHKRTESGNSKEDGRTVLTLNNRPVTMSFSRNSPKLFLLAINFLLFLSGLALLITGLWLLRLSGLMDSDVKFLLASISDDRSQFGYFLFAITILFIVAGGILLFVSVFGAVSAWKKIKPCLIIYLVVTICVIVVQGVIVGMLIKSRVTSGEWLEGALKTKLQSYTGPTATDSTSVGFNKMFLKVQCCGVSSYADMAAIAAWSTKPASTKVPASCCKGADDTSSQSSTTHVTCTDTPQDFYATGCFEKIDTIIDSISLISKIVSGISFICHVLAIVLSCLTMDRVTNRIQHLPPTAKPPSYIGIDAVLKNKAKI